MAQEQADWPSSNYITVDLEVQLRSKARGRGAAPLRSKGWGMILGRKIQHKAEKKERKIFVLEVYFFVYFHPCLGTIPILADIFLVLSFQQCNLNPNTMKSNCDSYFVKKIRHWHQHSAETFITTRSFPRKCSVSHTPQN